MIKPFARFRSGLLAVLFLCPLVAQAQVTITITGTPWSTGLGYTQGTPYTVSFTISSFGPTSTSFFMPGLNLWTEDYVTDPQLFSMVSGTAVQGTYTRPTGFLGSPYSVMTSEGTRPGYLDLLVSADPDGTDTIGLTSLGGTPLTSISFAAQLGGVSFAAAGDYVDPVAHFAQYTGLYTSLSNGPSLSLGSAENQYLVEFEVLSVSISSGAAVPEPSTYAALAGLVAFGLTLWRRRRQGMILPAQCS